MLFNNLKNIGYVSHGSYGQITEFALPDNSRVVIKSIAINDQLSDDTIAEITALQILKNKPHIIQILDIRIVNNVEILFMKYTSDLFDFMKSERSMQIFDILVNQLLKGLAYIHSEYIVHGDIKPANILVNYTNNSAPEFFYADFGLADLLLCTPIHDKAPKFNQTRVYQAPEIINDDVGYTFEPDIWALAVTFIQFLTGDIFVDYDSPLQSIKDLSVNGHINVKSLIGEIAYTSMLESMLMLDYQVRAKITNLISVNSYPQVNYMPTRQNYNLSIEQYKETINWGLEVFEILESPIYIFLITNDLFDRYIGHHVDFDPTNVYIVCLMLAIRGFNEIKIDFNFFEQTASVEELLILEIHVFSALNFMIRSCEISNLINQVQYLEEPYEVMKEFYNSQNQFETYDEMSKRLAELTK